MYTIVASIIIIGITISITIIIHKNAVEYPHSSAFSLRVCKNILSLIYWHLMASIVIVGLDYRNITYTLYLTPFSFKLSNYN